MLLGIFINRLFKIEYSSVFVSIKNFLKFLDKNIIKLYFPNLWEKFYTKILLYYK